MFADKPGPPDNLKVTGVTEATVSLVYEAPEDDGGSPIKQYQMERREQGKRAWVNVGTSKDLTYVADALTVRCVDCSFV